MNPKENLIHTLCYVRGMNTIAFLLVNSLVPNHDNSLCLFTVLGTETETHTDTDKMGT